MTWILIIAMHVGVLGSGNSNAITSVPGFKTKQSCESAAAAVKPLMDGTVKEIRTVCVEQS